VDPRAGLDDMEKRKFLILPGLELRPLGRPARSQSLYRLRYTGSCSYNGVLLLMWVVRQDIHAENMTKPSRGVAKSLWFFKFSSLYLLNSTDTAYDYGATLIPCVSELCIRCCVKSVEKLHEIFVSTFYEAFHKIRHLLFFKRRKLCYRFWGVEGYSCRRTKPVG
jgi:hypothetical protein